MVSPERPKLVIGLIGGIGSGKSLVAEGLRQRGGQVISGDRLGHEALRQPEIKARVVQRWGNSVLDAGGEVDRKKVGAIVFANEEERRALEAIVHPWIEKKMEEGTASVGSDPAVALVVLDAAILLEAGWNKFCDRVLFVDAPRAIRLERLASQRGWSEKEVTARENAQKPLPEKRSRADAVVDNSGPPERLAGQLDDLLKQWGIVRRDELRRSVITE